MEPVIDLSNKPIRCSILSSKEENFVLISDIILFSNSVKSFIFVDPLDLDPDLGLEVVTFLPPYYCKLHVSEK